MWRVAGGRGWSSHKCRGPRHNHGMAADKPLSVPQKALRKLGLVRDIDLALHLPLRYEDETRLMRLADVRDGETGQFEAEVVSSDWSYRPRRQLVVVVRDGDETCTLRFFNAYPSLQKSLAPGQRVRLRGEVRGGFMGRTIMHPVVQAAGGELPAALTPVYPTSAGLPQAYLRRAVQGGLSRCLRSGALTETVPADALPPQAWPLARALQFLHHPTPDVPLTTLEDRSHPAWQRLKAEELLTQQLSQWQSRQERLRLRAPALVPSGAAADLPQRLLQALPFGLTGAQARVQAEIAADLSRHEPMHRLLQGDVGSGKTVVAALAAAQCMAAGWQCALMAPTEILAEQHFRKLIGWLEPLLAPLGLEVAWLTGSQKKKTRDAMLALIADGRAALVVGTHAVIQAQVQFRALALAIIDEQHRFGVAQRLALRDKLQPTGEDEAQAVAEPHLLMMSATPIPRTLAMSYYADLDVSTLDELPPGRTPVVTKVVSESRREEVIERIRAQVDQGRQVYWVCPLIEESEALDLRNATDTHAQLTQALQAQGGAEIEVGLLHSRLPEAEKKDIMARFVSGAMAVLVSTTVIEVGVDVPNASLMVIEHAERFGLSQL
ncbi:MAG: ATP-dependent DNA helicase RecG, partial [Limnohabitans sp.]|nr:ATP-dependent DNA helicase RecG [Limnohabitans sp.]